MAFDSCQAGRNGLGQSFPGRNSGGGLVGRYGINSSCVEPPSPLDAPSDQAGEPQVLGGQFTFSDYGKFIPLVYGSFIVTGNVFWQGEWREHVFTRDNQDVKIYVTDFALGLCEGVINDVLRIWVGDILVYDKRIDVDNNDIAQPDEDGVLARTVFNYGASAVKGLALPNIDNLPELYEAQMGIQTRFVVYNGSEYQMAPDKMVAIDGKEDSPGYRGTAFILFENFFSGADAAPVIRVEVLANATPRFARVLESVPDNSLFDRLDFEMCYDQEIGVIYVAAQGTPDEDSGQVSIRASDLQTISDHQWYNNGSTTTPSFPRPDNLFAATIGGHLAISVFEGNDGRVINGSPWAQQVLGDIHATNPLPVVHQPSGPAYAGTGSCSFNYFDDDDVPCTILALTGFVSGSNCLGFMTAYEDGSMAWNGYVNDILATDVGSASNEYQCCAVPLIVDPDFAASRPEFPDGAQTQGGHVYVFTIPAGGVYVPDVLHVDRVTFAPAPPIDQADADDPNRPSLANPLHEYIGAFSLDLIGGTGRQQQIINYFIDPVDKCFVLAISVVASGTTFSDRILKFSPFTNQIVWNKTLPANLDTEMCQGGMNGAIGLDRTWAYASIDNQIVLVDLVQGDTTVVIEDTVAELGTTLSAISNLSQSVWLGDEGALVIRRTNAFGLNNLIKVWLTRSVGGTVLLGDVINDLLIRSGWDKSNLQISTDVNGIGVRGYAILAEKDVRTAISELRQVFGFDVIESNGSIQYLPRGAGSSVTIPYDHLKETGEGPLTEIIDTDIARLRKVSLKYFDIDRDYQENVQIGLLPEVNIAEYSAESAIEVSAPIVLNAQEAKVLAEGLAYQKSVYEANYQFSLPPKYQTIDPGDVITVQDGTTPLVMRVRDTEIGADHEVRVNAVTEDEDIYNDTAELFAAVGDFNDDRIPQFPPILMVEPLRIAAPSYLHLQRIEDSNDALNRNNALVWFYDFNLTGETITGDHIWHLSKDGVRESRTAANATRPTWGYVTQSLDPNGSLYSTDTRSTLIVRLAEEGSLSLASLASTQVMIENPTFNLAVVGEEVIQFTTVVDNMDGSYTFTGIHRARLGTDAGARAQRVGNKFFLVTDETGQFGPGTPRGQVVRVQGYEPDARIETITLEIGGQPRRNPLQRAYTFAYEPRLYKPWSPTGFAYGVDTGDLTFSWRRRARDLDAYLDDGDATLPFTDANLLEGFNERWEVILTDAPVSGVDAPTTFLRRVVLDDVSEFTYTAAMQAEDGVDITTDTLYAYVRFLVGKTGREIGWPGKFTMWPVQ